MHARFQSVHDGHDDKGQPSDAQYAETAACPDKTVVATPAAMPSWALPHTGQGSKAASLVGGCMQTAKEQGNA